MIVYKFVDGSGFLFKYWKVCFFICLEKLLSRSRIYFIPSPIQIFSGVRKISRRDLRDHWVQFPVWPIRKGGKATWPEFTAKLGLMCCFKICKLCTCTRMFKRLGWAGSAESKRGLNPFFSQSLNCLSISSNEFNDNHIFPFYLSHVCPT